MTMAARNRNRPQRLPRWALIAVVVAALLLVALRALTGGRQSSPSLIGTWRSTDAVQAGQDPPRTATFTDNTVVLGQLEGAGGAHVQNTSPLPYTRDATHIVVSQGSISVSYGYTLTDDTLTLSTGAISFTYHRA